MAIDLGTAYTKVAVMLPGVGMEIALDGLSKRSIPTLVLLKHGNRLFGNDAVASITRDPTVVFAELPSIIGKTLDHPAVLTYRERYPYHKLVFSREHGQLAFVVNGKEYTVEALLSMFLQYVRKTAEVFAESEMKTAVITVPNYFTQAERRALLRSASLASIEVVQLLDDNAAVALHFIRSILSRLEENPIYLFCDIGATGTTLTVVSYQMAGTKGDSSSDYPHVFVIGTASDATLGANAFIDRLQAHMIGRFKQTHSIDTDITTNARTVAKFRREAEHVFRILSANKDIQAVGEEIYNGHDLRLRVSREELQQMSADIVARIQHLISAALELANTPIDNIKDVIIFGGGSRIPMIQQAILTTTGREALGKNINADEAAALGAIHQALLNTHSFLVKRVVVRASNEYSMAVTFPQTTPENGDQETAKNKEVTRILFPAGAPFPQKRTVTFPRLHTDTTIRVHYANPSGNVEKHLNGATDVLHVNISGIAEKVREFDQNSHTPQAVKVHLGVDASGLLYASEVNLIMANVVPPNTTEESRSTLTKLASGISNFFGSGEDSPSSDKSETESSTSQTSELPSAAEVTNKTAKLSESQKNASDIAANATDSVPQKKTSIHPLLFNGTILDIVAPPSESITISMAILQAFDAADNEQRLLEKAKNQLEQTIFATFANIESEFQGHTTPEELTSVNEITKEIAQWYDDEGFSTPRSAIEERLEKLEDAIHPLKRRVQAFVELPKALDDFEQLLDSRARPMTILMVANSANETVKASKYVQSLNETVEGALDEKNAGLPIYSNEEAAKLTEMVVESRTWLLESREAFNSCDRKSDPPVKLSSVLSRQDALSAKLDYYGHKGETWFTTYKRLLELKKITAARVEAEAKAAAAAAAAAAASATANATTANATVIDDHQSPEDSQTNNAESASTSDVPPPPPPPSPPREDL